MNNSMIDLEKKLLHECDRLLESCMRIPYYTGAYRLGYLEAIDQIKACIVRAVRGEPDKSSVCMEIIV